MKDHHDPWYVRLPDGRVVKAKSTTSVRHHVEAGNIPLNSAARRDAKHKWVLLTGLDEFTDLGSSLGKRIRHAYPEAAQVVPASNGSHPETALKSGISARLDPLRLHTVGIRGLVDELIAAFDSTVSSGKLVVACAVCLIGSLIFTLIVNGTLAISPGRLWPAEVFGGIVAALSLAVITALLSRQTHLELSFMRPVPPSEAWQGVGAYVVRVFLGYTATIGTGIGLLILLRNLPDWLARATDGLNAPAAETLQTALWGISLLAAIGLFALMLLSFLLPPILIVEECSLGDAIREWRALLREHRVRVIVYEGMAVALALVASLPVALPIQLALISLPLPPALNWNWMSFGIPCMLYALAAGPAIAFMSVANLFIYLNLRYEFAPNQ